MLDGSGTQSLPLLRFLEDKNINKRHRKNKLDRAPKLAQLCVGAPIRKLAYHDSTTPTCEDGMTYNVYHFYEF